MTNKQITIDNIDVSGCTRYCVDNGKCTAFKSQYLCSERNNCYTKRILKKNKTINILKEKLLRKEQECEELKETFDGLFKVQYKLADTNKKLRQCLTEIKEIAKKIANYYDGDEYELMRKDAEQILQKISECEGNDE